MRSPSSHWFYHNIKALVLGGAAPNGILYGDGDQAINLISILAFHREMSRDDQTSWIQPSIVESFRMNGRVIQEILQANRISWFLVTGLTHQAIFSDHRAGFHHFLCLETINGLHILLTVSVVSCLLLVPQNNQSFQDALQKEPSRHAQIDRVEVHSASLVTALSATVATRHFGHARTSDPRLLPTARS
jgi:hypothetical protein